MRKIYYAIRNFIWSIRARMNFARTLIQAVHNAGGSDHDLSALAQNRYSLDYIARLIIDASREHLPEPIVHNLGKLRVDYTSTFDQEVIEVGYDQINQCVTAGRYPLDTREDRTVFICEPEVFTVCLARNMRFDRTMQEIDRLGYELADNATVFAVGKAYGDFRLSGPIVGGSPWRDERGYDHFLCLDARHGSSKRRNLSVVRIRGGHWNDIGNAITFLVIRKDQPKS
ncbi:TPA: hypothetical protein DEP96_00885 [Candidatus Uhrbacteria bacterium]|nr:hypothetical protein [Candidatus Uhrbacteria bacterium]